MNADCDRCIDTTPATEIVICWYGCQHAQCVRCARQTELEAQDKDRHIHCGARTVFWPEEEACDAECILPEGHQPANVHQDEILGEWTDNSDLA